jgi:hypothetical protein
LIDTNLAKRWCELVCSVGGKKVLLVFPLVGEIQRLSTRSATLRSTICIKCVHALSMLSVFIYVYWCLTRFLYHMMFVSLIQIVERSVAERVERRWISPTSGRNPRSSKRTSASTCFFCFKLKTKHVDFIHAFACQYHVYYTKYYNATCNAVNTHLFKTALNLLGEIS